MCRGCIHNAAGQGADASDKGAHGHGPELAAARGAFKVFGRVETWTCKWKSKRLKGWDGDLLDSGLRKMMVR